MRQQSKYNSSKKNKISKNAGPGKTRDITLIIPDTLEIIWKPDSAIYQNIIMVAYRNILLTNYAIKKHQ
jgi:hypothetical protein